jgi:hypothetical protein
MLHETVDILLDLYIVNLSLVHIELLNASQGLIRIIRAHSDMVGPGYLSLSLGPEKKK